MSNRFISARNSRQLLTQFDYALLHRKLDEWANRQDAFVREYADYAANFRREQARRIRAPVVQVIEIQEDESSGPAIVMNDHDSSAIQREEVIIIEDSPEEAIQREEDAIIIEDSPEEEAPEREEAIEVEDDSESFIVPDNDNTWRASFDWFAFQQDIHRRHVDAARLTGRPARPAPRRLIHPSMFALARRIGGRQ